MSHKLFFSNVLLRVVYPLILVPCIAFRPCAFSFVYLLILLYIPIVPSITVKTYSGHSGKFLKVCLAFSVFIALVQISLQCVSFSFFSKESYLKDCDTLEKILRHIGLIKLYNLNVWPLLQWLAPDLVALIAIVTIILVVSSLVQKTIEDEEETKAQLKQQEATQAAEVRLPPKDETISHSKDKHYTQQTQPPQRGQGHVHHHHSGRRKSRPLIHYQQPPVRQGTSTTMASSEINRGNKVLTSLGAYGTIALLCVVSSIHPSIPNGIYFIVFLVSATGWSLSFNLNTKGFGWFLGFLSFPLAMHIFCIYLYQMQWFQEILPKDDLAARLSGLVPLVSVNCTEDPRIFHVDWDEKWAYFANPFALVALFHIIIYEVKILFHQPASNELHEKLGVKRSSTGEWTTGSGRSRQHRFTRRHTTRCHPHKTSRRAIEEPGALPFRYFSSCNETSNLPSESTPLISVPNSRPVKYGTNVRSFSGDGAGTLQINPGPNKWDSASFSRGHSITSKESSGQRHATPLMSPVNNEDGIYPIEYDGYSTIFNSIVTLFDLFAKSSYIGTNIIMMTWSITYHSWLTFVLLLWACILWMFPNQRRAMLFSSPELVLYAEILLIVEYIYSLNLNDDELPVEVNNIDLKEIGLVKPASLPCTPLLVKCLYTLMFWVSLRQFVVERRSTRAAIKEAAQESFHITVTSARGGAAITELRATDGEGQHRKKKTLMDKVGSFLQDVLTKFWIWVVAIMLFVIGLGGDEVVLYRIVYMALFLIFILTFQLSYGAWRKMMYGFWLTVIIYSMLVLVSIYIYQFEDIPQYLSNYSGIPAQLQQDIGLEKYDTGSLFIRLLTPTFFVVITVIQLHYFHQDFLKLSDLSGAGFQREQTSRQVSLAEDGPPNLIDNFNLADIWKFISYYGTKAIIKASEIFVVISEFVWRFLEIHIMKIVLFSGFMLTIYEKSALHMVLFFGVTCAVAVSSDYLRRFIMHFCSIYISVLLLAKMIYQIDYIDHSYWDSNCTSQYNNVSLNNAEWLGLQKIENIPGSDLPSLLKGYIGVILVLTVQAVVKIRQKYQRCITRTADPGPGILFKNVCREDADKGILLCLKFLANYGFHKFGVEVTMLSLVAVIGTRLDLYSVLYSLWLIPLFFLRRDRLYRMWLPFIVFIAISLPLQYIACVGLPPLLCPEYPWDSWNLQLKTWLFLPDIINPPESNKLIADFFLLLFACQQYHVFSSEYWHVEAHYHPGGFNAEVLDANVLPMNNPTPDFLTYTKTWLDVGKKAIFLSFYWVSLAIIFLTGTNRVNLFALGYLVGSFIFLWEGNEFYLRNKRSIIKRWNYLLAYNVFVIFSKSLLQLIGCVFLTSLHQHFCWLIQLLGVACLNKFVGINSAAINKGLLNYQSECSVPTDEAGMMWDGITFGFLIFQRRIFNSHYFFHIRAETEVQAQLASRGAELIEELMQKQIRRQEREEKEVLEKIKMKMERIKAVHEKGRTKGVESHYDGAGRGASSMVSSPISLDETLPMVVEEKSVPSSPLAPLAAPVCTAITSGSGPTPTPSSAAQTLSVDGFFEPMYGRNAQEAMLHPPALPLSSDEESYPTVFSPTPFDTDPVSSRIHPPARSRHTAPIQTQPSHDHDDGQHPGAVCTGHAQRYQLSSPALSHHTSIRSGDYYMFEDDDDLEMIDSIEEECDENMEDGRLPGITLTELMSSVMKTDVESAAERARQARRASELRDGSLSESFSVSQKKWTGQKGKAGTKGADNRHSMAVSEDMSSAMDPLSMEEAAVTSRDEKEDGERLDGDADHSRKLVAKKPSYLRKIIGYFKFAWAVIESLMISMAAWLNKYSRDYRHVSKCLTKEKFVLKEKEFHYKATELDLATITQENPIIPPETSSQHVSLDIDTGSPSQKPLSSTEESGDGESKDDLQTVVEKPSPTKETAQGVLPQTFDSLDDLSLSDIDEEQSPFIMLMVSIWYVVISHSDLVCYFIVFLNQIKSASILSLPLPLMVLLWGTLSVPRPTKTFWVTIIAYTEALVVIKYLFQFDFFPWNDVGKTIATGPFWPPRILGIEQREKYAAYDVTLLMVVFFHRFMLKSLGLWKNKGASTDPDTKSMSSSEEVSEEMKTSGHEALKELLSKESQAALLKSEEKLDRISDISNDSSGEFISDEELYEIEAASSVEEETRYFTQIWQQWRLQAPLQYGPDFIKSCVIKYMSSIKLFFYEILNVEYKVKVDVYWWMFVCDFFNLLVVIFGFASFGSQTGDVSSYLEENKVPIPFLVMVILQFALIVIDRALYLRKYIMGKFFFQIAMATLVHISMFFVLPGVTDRKFNKLMAPQIWYMVKCIYLLFSAYQIRSGYPTRILGNFLCKKYNYLNMFLFKGFMVVPFLFEMRALMDWIWTDTSMTLSDWLKLEDIFAHVFQLKCQRRAEKEYPQERGKPKQRWTKYAIGGSSLFIIIAIIWFPLVLFALGNKVGLPNKPSDVSVELTIGSFEPIFTMSAQKAALKTFSQRDWSDFYLFFNRDNVGANFLNNYEHEDVVRAVLSGSSSSVWTISPPARRKLVEQLQSDNATAVRFSWTISRDTSNPTVQSVARGKTHEVELTPGSDTRKHLLDMINGTYGHNHTYNPVKILSIFPKFLKVANSDKATVIDQLNQGLEDKGWSYTLVNSTEGYQSKQTVLRNLTLNLQTVVGDDNDDGYVSWWVVKEDCSEIERTRDLPLGDKCENLNLYTFNEKAFPPTLSFISGGGIIGLYTTFVLVISKFVRTFFAGISFLIMFDDMPNVDRICQLCLDIYLVRESGELALEEDLFAKLIFLYRSPETLIKWTRPKTERQPQNEEQPQGEDNRGSGVESQN